MCHIGMESLSTVFFVWVSRKWSRGEHLQQKEFLQKVNEDRDTRSWMPHLNVSKTFRKGVA